MSTRDWQPRDDRAFDTFDVLEEGATIQRQIRDEILPQAERRAAAAAGLTPVQLAYFQRIPRSSGRRCSCFSIETSPVSECRSCFGTGVVGGYRKVGYREEVIDVARPDVRAVNVQPLFDRIGDAPRRWGLLDSANYGVFECAVPIERNVGILDAYSAAMTAETTAGAWVYLKSPHDADWTLLERGVTLASRLGEREIAFRVVLSRSGGNAPAPSFEHMYFRYQVAPTGPIKKDQPGTFVLADVKRTPRSLARAQIGLNRAFETRTTYLGGALRSISTEDFFHQQDTGDRWKIERVNDGASLGVAWEWVVETRIVQAFEHSYGRVP